MDVLFCEGDKDYGESVYKHTDLYTLLNKLEVRTKAELQIREGSPFTVSIYQIPFVFLLKEVRSWNEFAYPYARRKTPPDVLYKLFRLRVLRVYWTQSGLRDRLANCLNCIEGWLFKDIFSDTQVAYQAFSPVEKILLVVRW